MVFPQVFLDRLHDGLISFNRVNLVIIDEVHHTAKNHPYAQIMREYHQYKEALAKREHLVSGKSL